jgi:hypothetical protein
MTGNKINHVYNGKFDWVDELDFRGDGTSGRKHAKRRKQYAKHAKHKEREFAKREIVNELADI